LLFTMPTASLTSVPQPIAPESFADLGVHYP
jgi:hypothetical protein